MEDIHGQLTGEDVMLPPEIMRDIISRLPVKPLCRFKLVSKPWRSLISNPDFIAKYSKDVYFQRRCLLFTLTDSALLYSLDVGKFLSENRTNVDVTGLVAASTEVDYLQLRGSPYVLYSSHGLFLVQLDHHDLFSFGLIDPVIKESKKLPNVPIWRLPKRSDRLQLYEVGFDHSTNEYKVINGQHYFRDGFEFSVYTLQTDSWRKIDGIFPYRPYLHDAIVANGAVHWLVRKLATEETVIISFLLAEEEVREIALPPHANDHWFTLGAFRNSLSITLKSKVACSFWVMKEYGVRESWTKMQVSKLYKELTPSGFWTKSHDLMVFDRSSLVMYNFSDGTFWNLSIGDISKGDCFGSVGIYVESLPSLIDQEQPRHERGKEDESTQ